jgi:iron complex outermembrane receptor protein
VSITDNGDKELNIQLRPTLLTGQSVEIVATAENLRGPNLEHASIKLTGASLRRNLGSTLSETLASQPGFDQRTMGAAPARPVIRGLGDERVLILQDGERTGDFSASSPDHAVSVDPVSANEIEIARGPAALAYGSNAIGGVINVVRNQIATSVPSNLSGTVTSQVASVNNGASLAGTLSIPLENMVLNVDLNGRYGDNFNSPSGTISNSGYLTSNSSVGLSFIKPWGYSGLAVSSYLSDYGIPPDPIGGHPNGVDIEMRKFQIESRSEILFDNHFFKYLEAQLSYRYYNHKEFEAADIIGTEFIKNSANITLKSRHRGIGGLDDGIIGLWGEFHDTFVFDRFNIESNGISLSTFTIQEVDIGPLHLEVGARLDYNTEIPKEDQPNSRIGNIRQRSFLGLATSGSFIYNFGQGFYAGTTFMHSFRPPTSDELYSRGPHVAAYSFEIGNPDLDAERGFGKELFLRYKSSDATIELSGYHNDFSNFIFPRDTGRENIFFPSLNDYQFVGVRAVIYGFEAQSEFTLLSRIVANTSISYTIGRRDLTNEEIADSDSDRERGFLPLMPPLQASVGLNYVHRSFSLGGNVRFASEQNRLSQFEEPTAAYTLIGLRSEYRFNTASNRFHTVSLNISNLTNVEYRNHLSRLKEVFPEPGRNISLLYRLYF